MMSEFMIYNSKTLIVTNIFTTTFESDISD